LTGHLLVQHAVADSATDGSRSDLTKPRPPFSCSPSDRPRATTTSGHSSSASWRASRRPTRWPTCAAGTTRWGGRRWCGSPANWPRRSRRGCASPTPGALVRAGTRHAHPTTDDGIAALAPTGARSILAIPLAPQHGPRAASKLSDHGVGMGDCVSTTLAPGYWWISTGRSLPWLTLTKARRCRRPPGRCQRWCRRPRRNHQHRRVTMPGPPSPRPARPAPTPTSPVVPTVRCTSQQRGRCDPQTVIGW